MWLGLAAEFISLFFSLVDFFFYLCRVLLPFFPEGFFPFLVLR